MRHSAGYINHTVATVLREWLFAFDSIVSSLESIIDSLSLFDVCVRLDSSYNKLKVMEDIVREISSTNGGFVINILHSYMLKNSGNPDATFLIRYLLGQVSNVYSEMLNSYIHTGELVDTYSELCVVEKLMSGVGQDPWETRFSLKKSSVPFFLTDHADRAVLAGKYVAILNECNIIRY